jgi:hypothetical protein
MVSLGLCFTNNRQVGKIRQIPKGSSRKNLFKRYAIDPITASVKNEIQYGNNVLTAALLKVATSRSG